MITETTPSEKEQAYIDFEEVLEAVEDAEDSANTALFMAEAFVSRHPQFKEQMQGGLLHLEELVHHFHPTPENNRLLEGAWEVYDLLNQYKSEGFK